MYCPNCSHIMEKQTTTDEIVFYCSFCKTSANGGPEDTLIISETRMSEDTDAYDHIKKYAALDKCNKRLLIPCPKCKFPAMSVVRIGERERAILVCFCGYEEYYT